jgi:hypothetical protein
MWMSAPPLFLFAKPQASIEQRYRCFHRRSSIHTIPITATWRRGCTRLAFQAWLRSLDNGYPWLEIECSRCKTPRDVDLCALRRPPTTFVHDLAGRLVCQKCRAAGKRPAATLLQLTPRQRHTPANE